jgi:hypothetical protein
MTYPAPPSHFAVVPTSRLAVASLVVGIVAAITMCFIPILPGAAAIALAIPALQRTGPQKLAGRGFAIAGLCLGIVALFISLLGLSVWLPVVARAREAAHRADCARNLQLVGQALKQYAIDGDGRFPPDLDTLLATSPSLDPEHLICPGSAEEAAEQGQALRFGANLSYVYVGAGLADGAPSAAVLAYEPVNNHERDGAHFLFADASVRFILLNEARTMIASLSAGENPPDTTITPATTPATRPAP